MLYYIYLVGDIEYCYYAYVDVKANLQESDLSFHLVGSGEQAQLARLGGEYPPHGATLPVMLGSFMSTCNKLKGPSIERVPP